jgi:hypothetical protein
LSQELSFTNPPAVRITSLQRAQVLRRLFIACVIVIVTITKTPLLLLRLQLSHGWIDWSRLSLSDQKAFLPSRDVSYLYLQVPARLFFFSKLSATARVPQSLPFLVLLRSNLEQFFPQCVMTIVDERRKRDAKD